MSQVSVGYGVILPYRDEQGNYPFANADYWNARSRHISYGSDVLGRKILKVFLTRIKPESLLEIGCGNGVLFKIYRSIAKVSACDWSRWALEKANLRCERHNYKVNLFWSDIVHNPPDGFWDLAVTRTCLMHIPPERISRAVKNISGICEQALIFEYWEPTVTETLSPHNWLHDYTTLFEDAEFKLEEVYVRGDVNQALFWFKK